MRRQTHQHLRHVNRSRAKVLMSLMSSMDKRQTTRAPSLAKAGPTRTISCSHRALHIRPQPDHFLDVKNDWSLEIPQNCPHVVWNREPTMKILLVLDWSSAHIFAKNGLLSQFYKSKNGPANLYLKRSENAVGFFKRPNVLFGSLSKQPNMWALDQSNGILLNGQDKQVGDPDLTIGKRENNTNN